MERPFIEFIQSQQIGWNSERIEHIRTGAAVRELSVDATSGASSLTIAYPPGWERPEDEVLTVDEEFFVLSGELEIGDITYGRYAYGHLPAGYHRAGMRSAPGAVVMTFFSGEPDAARAQQHSHTLETERVVEKIDALAGEWGAGFNPKFPPGAGRKWLRRDPVTHDETWILGTMPLRNGFKREKHPVVEEMYLLSGELHGPNGVMGPGAYFWRPPEEWHGPFGSLSGNVMLFRTVGGPLSTVYDDNEVPFSWDPQLDPILPPELSKLPVHDAPRCTCF